MFFCVMSFFFFKQKTAYEMRISDWSSGVCSSDLGIGDPADGFDGCDHDGILDAGETAKFTFSLFNNGAYVPGEKVDATLDGDVPALMLDRPTLSFVAPAVGASATARDRKGGVEGKRGSGSGDRGGRRILEKKTTQS